MMRAQLEAMYPAEKAERERRTDFFTYGIYRPLSIAVTPAFLRVGATATSVTALNLLMAALMPVAALVAAERAYLWLALLILACTVLDCVDGNIARVTGSCSRAGQYVDSLAGKTYFLLLVVALAIVAAGEVPGVGLGGWLAIALSGALLKIWARESRAYFTLNFADATASFAAGRVGWQSLLFSAAKLLPLGVLALGPLGLIHLLLVALLLLNTAGFVYTQGRIFKKLAR